MAIRSFFHFVLIVFLAVIQAAFVSGLPGLWAGAQVILVVLVFFLVLNKNDLSFAYAFFAGLLLDIYSLAPFGLHTLSLVSAVFLSWISLQKIITNRSLYSYLMLFVMANAVYKILFFSLFAAGRWFFAYHFVLSLDSEFFMTELRYLALNLLMATLVFYLINYISKKYKPVFLNTAKPYVKI